MLQLLRFSSTTELENIALSHPGASHVRLLWCSAIFNWNNVEDSALFTFDLGGNTCQIPAGQYSVSELCAAMQTEIRAELSDGSATCVYDSDLNRVVITTTGSQALANIGSGMARLTGLVAGSAATSHTGTSPPNTSLGDIYVSMINWNHGRENQSNKSFFCVIPKASLNSIPIYDNLYNVRLPVQNQTYSNYNVKLTNEYGLTMSGVEASLMLAFES